MLTFSVPKAFSSTKIAKYTSKIFDHPRGFKFKVIKIKADFIKPSISIENRLNL